jgi:hypothetical protein
MSVLRSEGRPAAGDGAAALKLSLSSGIGIHVDRQRKPKLARRVVPISVVDFQQSYVWDTVAGGW